MKPVGETLDVADFDKVQNFFGIIEKSSGTSRAISLFSWHLLGTSVTGGPSDDSSQDFSESQRNEEHSFGREGSQVSQKSDLKVRTMFCIYNGLTVEAWILNFSLFWGVCVWGGGGREGAAHKSNVLRFGGFCKHLRQALIAI